MPPKPGAFFYGSVRVRDGNDRGNQRFQKRFAVCERKFDHVDLARKFAGVSKQEELGKLISALIHLPQAVPRILHPLVNTDSGKPLIHQLPCRVRLLLQKLILLHRLGQSLGNLSGAQYRQAVQCGQSVARLYLPQHERQRVRAQSCAKAGGYERIYVVKQPHHRFRRHHTQQAVSAGARQAGDNAPDVCRVKHVKAFPRYVLLTRVYQILDFPSYLLNSRKRYCLPGFKPAHKVERTAGSSLLFSHVSLLQRVHLVTAGDVKAFACADVRFSYQRENIRAPPRITRLLCGFISRTLMQ